MVKKYTNGCLEHAYDEGYVREFPNCEAWEEATSQERFCEFDEELSLSRAS